MHSLFSDGKYPPSELAARAKRGGIGLFSLTDHDTMDGCEEAARAAEACGIGFVNGWEISAYEGACKVHVLGYGCEENEAYRAFERERREGAEVRVREMIERANAFFGLNVTRADAERFHTRKSAPVHTMHAVAAFAEALSADRGELYRTCFARGGPAFSEACRPTPEEAIAVIHACGGVAVLAHPGRILRLSDEKLARLRTAADEEERRALLLENAKERDELIERLLSCGLDGIECFYTTHTVMETEHFLSVAKGRGLLITGGSDFHADDGAHVLGAPAFSPDPALLRALRIRESE